LGWLGGLEAPWRFCGLPPDSQPISRPLPEPYPVVMVGEVHSGAFSDPREGMESGAYWGELPSSGPLYPPAGLNRRSQRDVPRLPGRQCRGDRTRTSPFFAPTARGILGSGMMEVRQ
jgi:hypothetical protein